jgi:hypothetical protein
MSNFAHLGTLHDRGQPTPALPICSQLTSGLTPMKSRNLSHQFIGQAAAARRRRQQRRQRRWRATLATRPRYSADAASTGNVNDAI